MMCFVCQSNERVRSVFLKFGWRMDSWPAPDFFRMAYCEKPVCLSCETAAPPFAGDLERDRRLFRNAPVAHG